MRARKAAPLRDKVEDALLALDLNTEQKWWKKASCFSDVDTGDVVVILHINAGVPGKMVHGRSADDVAQQIWYFRNRMRP